MGLLLRIAGLTLALFCWFNPLGFEKLFLTSLFILGFDMMGSLMKLVVFTLNFVFPVFGESFNEFSWTLLIMFMVDLILKIVKVEGFYKMAIRPLIVFLAAFLSVGLQPAIVIGGIDLLINPTHKN